MFEITILEYVQKIEEDGWEFVEYRPAENTDAWLDHDGGIRQSFATSFIVPIIRKKELEGWDWIERLKPGTIIRELEGKSNEVWCVVHDREADCNCLYEVCSGWDYHVSDSGCEHFSPSTCEICTQELRLVNDGHYTATD